MPVAAAPRNGERPTAEVLRDLMTQHGLTNRDVSQLASVSHKTVESWLADRKSTNHRTMHPRYLNLIMHMLPGFLAARRGRKD